MVQGGQYISNKLNLPAVVEKFELDKIYETRIAPTFQAGTNKVSEWGTKAKNVLPLETVGNKLNEVGDKLQVKQWGNKLHLSELKDATMDLGHSYFVAYLTSLSYFVSAWNRQPNTRKLQMSFILFFNGMLPLFFLDTAQAYVNKNTIQQQ
jgi:hypothetical protein